MRKPRTDTAETLAYLPNPNESRDVIPGSPLARPRYGPALNMGRAFLEIEMELGNQLSDYTNNALGAVAQLEERLNRPDCDAVGDTDIASVNEMISRLQLIRTGMKARTLEAV